MCLVHVKVLFVTVIVDLFDQEEGLPASAPRRSVRARRVAHTRLAAVQRSSRRPAGRGRLHPGSTCALHGSARACVLRRAVRLPRDARQLPQR